MSLFIIIGHFTLTLLVKHIIVKDVANYTSNKNTRNKNNDIRALNGPTNCRSLHAEEA